MYKRFLDILTAFGLGIVCPAIMVYTLFLPETAAEPTIPATEPFVETQTVNNTICVDVLMDDGSVLSMDLEEYLVGVVLKEMPADFEFEALKAQAVVARTYALRRYETGGKHTTADLCTDPSCCQGYCSAETYIQEGQDINKLQRVKDAVHMTSGLVLRYNGALIEATYFSCSGGNTEDAVAVWGADIPYLQSVESPGEESATHYMDTVTLSTSSFCDMLGLSAHGTPESWIESISYTNGGGIDSMRICGNDFTGTELRSLLNLRSTAFVMTILGDKVTITTKGFGHRVGMSQYGADAMAADGSPFDEILTHYYQGVQLEQYG